MGLDLESELDTLYRLPLTEFVAARNELAKRLRKGGERVAADRVAADRIKALAKPSLTAWAVNQLAFWSPNDMQALADAGAKVRAAHLAAPAEQQVAVKARRAAISTLLGLAAALFEKAGQPFGRLHRQRISLTLEALSSQVPGSDQPRAGRLSKDLEPQGFDALTDLAAALGEAQKQRQRAAPAEPADKPAAGRITQAEALPMRAELKPTEPDPREAKRQKLVRRIDVQRQALRQLEKEQAKRQAAANRAGDELCQAESTEVALNEAAAKAERLATEARQQADAAAASTQATRGEVEAVDAALVKGEGEIEEAQQALQTLEEAVAALGER